MKRKNNYDGIEEDLSLGSILVFLLVGIGMIVGMAFALSTY